MEKEKTMTGEELAKKISKQIPEFEEEFGKFLDAACEKYHILAISTVLVRYAERIDCGTVNEN